MKPASAVRQAVAFTYIDVLVVVALLVVLASLLIPRYMTAKAQAQRIRCTSHLKQIGLSYKTWSIDHGDRFPMEVPMAEGGAMEAVSTGNLALVYQVMSNELSTAVVLRCPADVQRVSRSDFIGLQNSNISYFVGLEASETNYQAFLSGDPNITNVAGVRAGILYASTNDMVGWNERIHEGNGQIGLADGSVQQLSIARLREAVANTGFATNRLRMP